MADTYICTICQSSIDDGREYLTTRCKHKFHAECIASNAKKNNNRCPNCRQPITIFPDVRTNYSNPMKNTNEKYIPDDDDEDVWDCPICTFKNSMRINVCEMCGQGMRIDQRRRTSSSSTPRNTYMSSTDEPDNSSITSYSPSYTPNQRPVETEEIESPATDWCCDYCDYQYNSSSQKRCMNCKEAQQPRSIKSLPIVSQRSLPPANDRPPRPEIPKPFNSDQIDPMQEPYEHFDPKPRREQNPVRVHPAKPSTPAIVYVPDLPVDKSDNELEQVIRTRLQDAHRIQVSKVECFSNLGIAIIHLVKQEDKDHLINKLQCIILYPSTGIKITCSEKLEVTSYIVLDKKQKTHHIDTIENRWTELFRSPHRPKFQTLSIQFPNLIKVTSFSIEELQAVAKFQVMKIEDQIAAIYTHVDCSYLEDLPRSQPQIDENHIFCFIATQLDMPDSARQNKQLCEQQANTLYQQIQALPSSIKELKSKFYIQYNEQSSNTIILASNSLHKWLSMNFININGQLIFKTTDISTRLIIKPIPHNFPLHLIYDQEIFHNSIRTNVSKLIGEHLIVEINDNQTYDECLNIKVFQVIHNGDRITLHILPYTTVEDPDNSDINIENWYGTQMQKYKPDITQFDAHHPIFRYKWNSKIWLDQFRQNKQEVEHINDPDKRRQNEFIRRMLRVTVMLNTMATMRKRKYVIEDSPTKTEVFIKPPSSLVTILYDHQSRLTQTSQTFTPPFSSTSVRVVNEDCLVSYNSLVLSGMKPLLLNMANETTPGGGYRKGDGAQEENLFRRSNYYMSLDYTMDAEQDQAIKNIRNYCSVTGQILPSPDDKSLYPIAEYGSIYTSGITVFRGTEDQGYPFLKKPLYDVCALAIAAYRDPSVLKKNHRLKSEFAIGTRKKIENFFAVAYKNGHDSLILSALGCGAFKNPPEHIALIFKSVILQYAGFFKEIIFAIIDDHNTGGRLNPDGNFLPFQQVLDKFVAHVPTNPSVGMSLGPYRSVQSKTIKNRTTIQEFILCDLPPCDEGGFCQQLVDENHCESYTHPPLCPLASECNEHTNDVHCQMFIHQRKCSKGSQCVETDPRHLKDFDHPEYCPEGGRCNNMRKDHLKLYRHVPICSHGIDCDLRYAKNSVHISQFRHCQRSCEFGTYCIDFHDQRHITNKQHPFSPPCPFTPFSCKMYYKFLQSSYEQNQSSNQNELNEIRRHCYRYSHVCSWGRQCTNKNEEHLAITIHVARQMCPNGESCGQIIEEDHLDSFSHPNIPDIRYLCRYPGSECRDRLKPEHIRKYRHNYTLDYLGVAQYFALNQQINFVENQIHMTKMIRDYVEKTYKETWNNVIVPDSLLHWIAALQPIHRCTAPIFESILVHGHVMSRSHMERLEDPIFVAHTVDQHKRVRAILANQVPAVQRNTHKLIEALVRKEFNIGKTLDDKDENKTESLDYRIHTNEQILKHALSKADLDEIRLCTSQIVEASIKLHTNMTGIGFKGDLQFRTNEQIFSILGPHTAQYYGDIVIIFKRDIMLHPDSNFTMQAATMYTEKTYKARPWLTDPGSVDGRVTQFHSTKLHCSVPGYDHITALELMAITGVQKQTMKVDLGSIVFRWKQIDGHQVIEGHLPQLIPLNYIDHIYMPKDVFESLPAEAQKNAQELFGHNLIITKHVVDLTINPMAFSKPDTSRVDYENYISEQITKLIRKQQEQHALLSTSPLLTSYGMTVTIPGTNFQNFIVNPLSMTQSYNQYLDQSGKTAKSDDSIYIYWKALRGDFMLVLTNEIIKPGEIQSDLIYLTCYIAPFVNSTTTDSNYDERYTYINDWGPKLHQIALEQKRFKAGSNTFHKGCNADDYILYCLKLNREKGQVSLMNAGFNGIYNRTVLKCEFKSDELDLSKLDYIHVSAGHQIVSIRNLVISHELIEEAHPKFDKEFASQPMDIDDNGSENGDAASQNNEDPDNQSSFSSILQPIKWAAGKIWGNNKQQRTEDDDNEQEEEQFEQIEYLKPCRDSIYCFDQYSREKSLNHNQKYSHPCRFSELCRDVHKTPHCLQYTHTKHDVTKCQQDKSCKKVIDPVHRYSHRHSDLPDFLFPCWKQKQCRDSTVEHRKKFFHGERITLPPEVQHIPKNVKKQQSQQSPSSKHTPQIQNPLIMDQNRSKNRYSSSPDHNAQHRRTQNRSKKTTSSYTSDENSVPVWSIEDEDSEEDLVSSFYNDDAGKSVITGAGSYDQYGNPIGRKYDLGKDGAFKDYNILIAQFYMDSQFNDAAMKVPIDALKVKGFQVKHVKNENECITELASNRYHIAWIISTSQIQNPSFISSLIKFHSGGGAIFLYSDNTPYVCHASEFLRTKFGITVEGNYYGGKTMTYLQNGDEQTGHFGQHEIFTGISNLFEGITICHPVYTTSESRSKFKTIATATDGNSCIAIHNPPEASNEGRLCLDCGFTKLYINWDAAGTARYIVNASVWLLGIERKLKAKKKSKKK